MKDECCVQSSVSLSVLASMFGLYLDTELLIQHLLVRNYKVVRCMSNKQLYISLLEPEQHLRKANRYKETFCTWKVKDVYTNGRGVVLNINLSCSQP